MARNYVAEPIIEAQDIAKYFKLGRNNYLHAVDDISLTIYKGSTLGVVGESGCGKSTLGRTILRLHEPTKGSLKYKGASYLEYSKRQMRQMRQKLQIIFQDPYSSLNPRMTVSELIAENIIVNKLYSNNAEVNSEVDRIMKVVGLAKRVANSYPHELDGGRRQRIGVARALSLRPEFIVCDEPVSSLDVSIQAQILNLLMDIQDEFGISYMFITHDLSVVKHISDEIMVMYMGKCVELAESDELFLNPRHPYTIALLSAIPEVDIRLKDKEFKVIPGEVISPINPQPGCRFATRCSYCSDRCTQEDPALEDVGSDHQVACFNLDKVNQT